MKVEKSEVIPTIQASIHVFVQMKDCDVLERMMSQTMCEFDM
jgi:hypothetical protein